MDLKVQGVPVHFPYKPYGCQLSMLNRVITALKNKQCCLLESPTGTGKTLALLCATLGWLEYQLSATSEICYPSEPIHLETCELSLSIKHVQSDDFGNFIEDKTPNSAPVCTCGATEPLIAKKNTYVPRIIYATRTHYQISQVIRELRKTKYSNVDMCILSSRKHTCINSEVRKQGNLNDACQNLKVACPYDLCKNKQNTAKRMRELNSIKPWDLEDYVVAMTKVSICPFFFAFKLLERATLCFCPYNYLLDPVFRATVSSELSGSVIIIDEAHNIEDAARAACSVTLLERDVVLTSEDLKCYLGLLESKDGVLAKDVTALINLLEAIHQVMMLTRSRLVVAGCSASSAQVWSGIEIEGLLSTVGLGLGRFEAVKASFNRFNITIQREMAANSVSKFPSSSAIRLFTYIFTMLKFLYKDGMCRTQEYRAVLMEVVDFEKQLPRNDLEQSVPSNRWLSKAHSGKLTRLLERKSLSLNFWCLSPAVCMRGLAENAHSLILASGTLSPLEALAAELRINFPVRLEASHVVPPQRVLAACVSRGPQGSRLCATFAHQNAFVFQDDVGHLLLEACQRVPGGVLCFFPSYNLQDKMIARWELTGLLGKLGQVKHVLREPRSSEKFDDWISEFRKSVDSTRGSSSGSVTGALALAVCRGKISEGLDFSDDYGRLVVAIGIPFPALKDPQVEQKRAFNDSLRVSSISLPIRTSLKRFANGTPSGCQKAFAVSRSSSPTANKIGPSAPLRSAPIGQVDASITSTELTKWNAQFIPSCVLSGSEWYEAQAYRALNQALGRCIRHRGDWGAIILAEARFVEQPHRYLPGISRWLRNQLVAHEKWSDLLIDLSEFVERMTQINGA